MTELAPRVAVVVFPGSNDDRDAALALKGLGAETVLHWHAEPELPEVGAVVLPGGFSYGDYLRAGAIARFSPAMRAVADFAADGGFVLGICNGFQVLCEAGLLPGVLRANESLSFVCRDVAVRVERNGVPFLAACEAGQLLTIPVKHGEGFYFADDELLERLGRAGSTFVATSSSNTRALSPKELAARAEAHFSEVIAVANPRKALVRAHTYGRTVLVTGSLYLLADLHAREEDGAR
jgi:phosphoribosylformylglycinamidine synthase I